MRRIAILLGKRFLLVGVMTNQFRMLPAKLQDSPKDFFANVREAVMDFIETCPAVDGVEDQVQRNPLPSHDDGPVFTTLQLGRQLGSELRLVQAVERLDCDAETLSPRVSQRLVRDDDLAVKLSRDSLGHEFAPQRIDAMYCNRPASPRLRAFPWDLCLLVPLAGSLGGHVPFPIRLGQLQGTAPDRLGNRGVAADALDEPFLRRPLRTQEPQQTE